MTVLDGIQAHVAAVRGYQRQRQTLIDAITNLPGGFNYYDKKLSSYRKEIDLIDEKTKQILDRCEKMIHDDPIFTHDDPS